MSPHIYRLLMNKRRAPSNGDALSVSTSNQLNG